MLYILVHVIGDGFVVKQSSMESTISDGDFVFVNRWKPGVRLPITLFSIPFSTVYAKLHLPYQRILKPDNWGDLRNKVVAFNSPSKDSLPIDKKPVWIKRVVALPGDTIYIRRRQIWVNGKQVHPTPNALRVYRVGLKRKAVADSVFSFLPEIANPTPLVGNNNWLLNITDAQMAQVDTLPQVKMCIGLYQKTGELIQSYFPKTVDKNWNRDYFGPFVVPFKGMEIKEEDYELYREVLLLSLEISETDSISKVQQDYFFMMGDNRSYSKDSRHFGPIAESHLVGVATWSIYSPNQTKQKWFQRIQ